MNKDGTVFVGRHKIGPYRFVMSLLRKVVCYYWRVFTTTMSQPISLVNNE